MKIFIVCFLAVMMFASPVGALEMMETLGGGLPYRHG